MGRRDWYPKYKTATFTVHLRRLVFSDGCYDCGGAYWGGPADVYHILSVEDLDLVPSSPWSSRDTAFGRAEWFERSGYGHHFGDGWKGREIVKNSLRAQYPNIKFLR